MNRYTQEPVPNTQDASESVLMNLAKFFLDPENTNYYHKYSPQLLATNESKPIYELQNHITPGSRVLTVSGSGEQPFFFKLYGAEYVLTFDISYNSYLLTSLKIAALQTFTKHYDYEHFVRSLIDHCQSHRLMSTPNMNKVFEHLSDIQKCYTHSMNQKGIPVFIDDILCQFSCIKPNDYNKLRNIVKSPFPFVWTDITELDKKLGDDTFDFVYYSNILGFLSQNNAEQVLEDTKKHVNRNGKIFLVEDVNMDLITSVVNNTYKVPDWNIKLLPASHFNGFNMFIIQHKQFTK